MPIIWRGKNWKQRKATMEMAVAAKLLFIGVLHAVIFLRTEVEADNRLEVPGNADDKGEEQHIHL